MVPQYYLFRYRMMIALASEPPPPAEMEGLPEEVSWVPPMDAIRRAKGAEIEAMESVLEAIASKQQSSFTKLRRQVDAIMAWKKKITERDRKAVARRDAARKETAEAAKKEEVAAGGPGNTHAVEEVTTTESAAIIAPAESPVDQKEEEYLELIANDSDDSREAPEERVEQGARGAERLTTVLVCVCLLLPLLMLMLMLILTLDSALTAKI